MRRWIALAALLVAAAALILLGVAMTRGIVGWLRDASTETVEVSEASDDAGAQDPMFEVPAERVTRPPELREETERTRPMDDDPSRHWTYQTLTPLEPAEPLQ